MRAFLLSSLLLLSACVGDRVMIQTGEIGKILGPRGLEQEIYSPGTTRLPYCGAFDSCPRLIRLQISKYATDLEIDKLFLPKSNVDIRHVKIGLQFHVKQNDEAIHQIFKEIQPTHDGNDLFIQNERIYETYIQRKAPDAIVKVLREYTVEDILANVPEIAVKVQNEINVMLEDAPIEITELGFPNGIGEPPEEVLVAKRKLKAIEEDKARRIRALEAELAVEDQAQAIQRIRVRNDLSNAKEAGVPYEVYVKLKNQDGLVDAMKAFSESSTPVTPMIQLGSD